MDAEKEEIVDKDFYLVCNRFEGHRGIWQLSGTNGDCYEGKDCLDEWVNQDSRERLFIKRKELRIKQLNEEIWKIGTKRKKMVDQPSIGKVIASKQGSFVF